MPKPPKTDAQPPTTTAEQPTTDLVAYDAMYQEELQMI